MNTPDLTCIDCGQPTELRHIAEPKMTHTVHLRRSPFEVAQPALLDDTDRLAALLHEARCGPEAWKGNEHVPWTDDHHEWDVATAKALRLLGVTLLDENEYLRRLRDFAATWHTANGHEDHVDDCAWSTCRGLLRGWAEPDAIARAYREDSDDLDCGCKHDGTQTLWLCDTHAATTATMARAYREDSDD